MTRIYAAAAISIACIASAALGVGLPGRAQTIVRMAERPRMGHPQQGTRRGGGSRGGQCDLPTNIPPLTALMPDPEAWVDAAAPIVFSFTDRAMPDLWFYLPARLLAMGQVTFTLKDASGETLEQRQLETASQRPTAPNIVRVSLAELELALAPGADYHWYLTVRCESGPPMSVDGWISYLPGDPLERSDSRFLVDTLSVLASRQWSKPDDEAALLAWRELLESVGLGDITDADLTDCCSFVEKIQN